MPGECRDHQHWLVDVPLQGWLQRQRYRPDFVLHRCLCSTVPIDTSDRLILTMTDTAAVRA